MAYLYKETRIGLDWVRSSATFDITVPKPKKQVQTHQALIQDAPITHNDHDEDLPPSKDDESIFSYENLATTSSIHFRAIHRFPRSILWRVIEGGKVLVLLPIDVSKPQTSPNVETGTAYRLRFPSAIQPSCVALFDSAEQDVLCIFALTKDNVLYTFKLKPDFFGTGAEETRLYDGWCHSYVSTTLTIRSPHFVRAISADTVLITLQDGGLIRFNRIIQEPDAKKFHGYQELVFSDGSYLASLKSLVRWNGAQIRFGDATISPETIISLALTYRYSLLFTVSINHRLKVWSLEKGIVLNVFDLANEPHVNSTTIRNFLDPTPGTWVTLIDTSLDPRHMFYLMTYSPANGGMFKLWAATDDKTASYTRLVDLYPNDILKVQPPSLNGLWVITDFTLSSTSKDKPNEYSLWLLWKSNTSFKLQNLVFSLERMTETFTGWMNAAPEVITSVKARTPTTATMDDVVNYWSEWIFQAGRFSDSVVETALKLYLKNYTDTEQEFPEDGPLYKRVHGAIELVLDKRSRMIDEDEVLEDDLYKRDAEVQWSQFYRLCTEFDKQRLEALSLSVDPASGVAYVANADAVTILREGTDAEILSGNLGVANANAIASLQIRSNDRIKDVLAGDLCADVTRLLQSATKLKQSLREPVFDDCIAAIQDEVLKPATASVADRIDALFDRCFEGQTPAALHQNLLDAFQQFDNLEKAFEVLVSSLTNWDKPSGQSKLTTFGEKLLLKGSQEMIHVNYTLLFDMILLLVYFYATVELSDFNTMDRIFSKMLQLLREHEVLAWLSKNSWPTSKLDEEGEKQIRQSLAKLRKSDAKSIPQVHNSPVLQILLDENSGPPPFAPGLGARTLTSTIRRFLSGVEMGNYDDAVTHIASRLLRMNIAKLASDFSPYLPITHWGCYMKARIALVNDQPHDAANYFRRVAYGVSASQHTPISSIETLFSPDEVAMLCAGLPKYYFHVAQLFEKYKHYHEVVAFTALARTALSEKSIDTDKSLRSDILSRQFNAGVQVEMYDEAYLALMSYTDKALQKQALKTLVKSMCENYAAEQLCNYPFIDLEEDVDETLEQKCYYMEDVKSTQPYHKILYAWRIKRGNYRGAAAVLYDYLQKLLASKTHANRFSTTEIGDTYLALLNVLSCVSKDQAWVFTTVKQQQQMDDGEDSGARKRLNKTLTEGVKAMRKVVTIDNIREEYQAELERLQVYLSGGYFF